MNRLHPSILMRLLCMVATLAASIAPIHAGEEIAVRAVVEKTDPVAGEPIRLQIQVQGSDQVAAPDLTAIKGASAVSEGGGASNRSYVSSINGRVTQNVFRGYLLNIRLTPAKPGILTIPALTVLVGGKSYQTQPIRLRVGSPEENPDFRMLMRLPRTTVYLGETIPVEFVWYIGKQPSQPMISAPILSMPEFRVHQPDAPQTGNSRAYAGISLNDEQTWGKLGQDTLDGRTWQTLTLTRFLTPQKSGVLELPPASVSGYLSSDDPFSDDPFFTGRPAASQRFFSTSLPTRLTVLELPAAGRPGDFSSLIGKYSIAAKIEPAEASVGEPLTLTVMLTGGDYMNAVELPDFSRQPALAASFRLPAERPESKMIGRVKVFTQTIRARSSAVKELPAIQLNFFNPETNQYETAETRPLPLTIHEAKIVTAQDIEGAKPVESTGVAVESAQGGIHHNYIDEGCLERNPGDLRDLGIPGSGWALLLFPPLLWLLIVSGQVLVQYRADHPGNRIAQTALKVFLTDMDGIETAPDGAQKLLQALRTFFAQRLGLASQSPTFPEIAPHLKTAGVTPMCLEDLQKVMSFCEAAAYAGAGPTGTISPKFAEAVRTLIKSIHHCI